MITKHDMHAILGEDFFKEEVRCDYLVSAEMKRIWAYQIDLYLVFSEICEKHSLQYFLFYGGLLGAIRHNGFIPWDDDLDVAMPREDYEKFLKIAPQELEDPYFLQTPYTDPNCFYSVVTLRNSSGTFAAKFFKNLDINKGIPMDIFPLDHCHPDTYKDEMEQIYENIMYCSTFMKRCCDHLNKRQKADQIRYHTDNPLEKWENINRIASNPIYKGNEYLAQRTALLPSKQIGIYPSRCFEKRIEHPFETITVKIPIGYDEILNIWYGNYMQFPKIEERGSKNAQLLFDPEHPYTYYKNHPELWPEE